MHLGIEPLQVDSAQFEALGPQEEAMIDQNEDTDMKCYAYAKEDFNLKGAERPLGN